MRKLLTVALLTLCVAGCGKSPGEKAKCFYQEIEAAFAAKDIDRAGKLTDEMMAYVDGLSRSETREFVESWPGGDFGKWMAEKAAVVLKEADKALKEASEALKELEEEE